MLANKNLAHLPTNTLVIRDRLSARITRWEFFALTVCMIVVILSIIFHSKFDHLPGDYVFYINAANGNLYDFFYAPWILPVFRIFARLPLFPGYMLWSFANIMCVFFAARLFGGRTALTLLSFQMFSILVPGQITGIIGGGLALGWWGMAHKRWDLAGLGFLIASTKFQVGMTIGLFLLLAADITWTKRLRVLLIPAFIALLSLLIEPTWPLDLLIRIRANSPVDLMFNLSAWRWFDAAALLFWLPPLLLPLSRPQRLLGLASATPLALPYFQQLDLIILFVLPVGWLPVLLGNVGYLFFLDPFRAPQLVQIVPITIYLHVLYSAISKKSRAME